MSRWKASVFPVSLEKSRAGAGRPVRACSVSITAQRTALTVIPTASDATVR